MVKNKSDLFIVCGERSGDVHGSEIIKHLLKKKSSLKIPAVYVSEQYSKIYSPYPAQIKEIFVNKDEIVTKGQELIKLYFL